MWRSRRPKRRLNAPKNGTTHTHTSAHQHGPSLAPKTAQVTLRNAREPHNKHSSAHFFSSKAPTWTQIGAEDGPRSTQKNPKAVQHAPQCTRPSFWKSNMDPTWLSRRPKRRPETPNTAQVILRNAQKPHNTHSSAHFPFLQSSNMDSIWRRRRPKRHPKAPKSRTTRTQCTRPSFQSSNMNQFGAQNDPRGAQKRPLLWGPNMDPTSPRRPK